MAMYINEDTQVFRTTKYTRHSKPQFKFSLVIKGMMISTALLGSIAFEGVSALAATNPSIPPSNMATQQVSTYYEDEQALVMNLNLALKVIKESGWSINALTAVMDKLTAIEYKLFEGDGFKSKEGLKVAILDTEKAVVIYGGDGLTALRGRNTSILGTIGRIKGKLGMITMNHRFKY